MPPAPRKRTSATRSVPSAQAKAAGGAPTGSSSPGGEPSPRPARARGVAQREVLREELKRTYMIVGTVIRPFGRWMPVMSGIGDNLKEFSEEAADAWMELADKDPKVMEAIKTMMSASTWGNVIGIHIAIFSAAIPGGAVIGAQKMQSQQEDSELDQMLGQMSPEEVELAKALAAQMMGASDTPARDQGSGGPGDTVLVPPAPTFTPPPVNVAAPASAAPPPVQSMPRASIVSPAELGITIPGQQGGYNFPADTQPPSSGGGAAT